MSEAIHSRAPGPERLPPRWRELGHAARFAGIFACLLLAAAARHGFAGRGLVAGIAAAAGAALLALGWWSERGGPAWTLREGMPAVLIAVAFALLMLTSGRSVPALILLSIAPAVAALTAGARNGAAFLAAAVGCVLTVATFAPATPWIEPALFLEGTSRVALGVPAALALYAIAASWERSHASWEGEMRASQAVLQATVARFRAYIENSHDVLAELDERGRLLYVSPTQADFFSRPLGDLLGSHAGDHIHPDDLAAGARVFASVANGGRRLSAPVRYRGADGSWRWLRVAASSYHNAAGQLRFVAQARDETALQLAQAERDRVVAELESALARIDTLRGRIAICASCKDVKTEGDVWEPLDQYVASRSLAEFSHGLCPRCLESKTGEVTRA